MMNGLPQMVRDANGNGRRQNILLRDTLFSQFREAKL
jgi:hypothetical protein